MTSSARSRPHVVVIGGGFGGVSAVRKLRGKPVDITVVDRNAYSTFQPLLYQVATAALNPGDVTYFLRALRAKQKNVRVRSATVTRIDPSARSVTLYSGEVLTYDYLVVASGVTTNYFGIPGAREHAMALYTRNEALALRDRLFGVFEQAADGHREGDLNLVIVGGGATGVEMAGALAELRNTAEGVVYPELDPARTHIVLVEMADELLTPFAPRLRGYTARALRKRGVELRLGTTVKEVTADEVIVDDGYVIPAQLVVWATGIKAPDEVADWGLPQGRGGRILVEEDLRVRGLDNVFAVGDIALTPEPLPQVAQPAMQGGKHAGLQIESLVAGRETAPFRYWDKGLLATIGRSSAVAQIKHVPGFTGLPAWLIWVSIHIIYLLGARNRFATLINLTVRYLFWPRHLDAIVGEVSTSRPEGAARR